MSTFVFRNAARDDWQQIGDLHAENWREAYAGILPDDYLQNEVFDDRRAHWKVALGKAALADSSGDDIVVLAFDDQHLVGFAAIVFGLDWQADVTLDNLHVRDCARRCGLGRELIARAVVQLKRKAASSLCLWVFDENEQAVGFYQRLGARKTATGIDTMHGADAPHTQFSWNDLDALLVACAEGKAK